MYRYSPFCVFLYFSTPSPVVSRYISSVVAYKNTSVVNYENQRLALALELL